ncbi:MarR family winged helix-turn-helix transcriptional regulator [Komagataeibacter rhaeticus]|uniref:MarR family winged helix-turn-helix transcriptional regulator n=1 Tax=Komagataeibacter rhaeticus TaxID=215221 RepID=UPI001F0A86AD|nr:MarR family transcriptional regulator [Komagataeibacter rhaeticus]
MTQEPTAAPQPPMPVRPDRHEQTGVARLEARPGFLIRRLHQIHVALFAEECGGFNITPVQYSIMSVAQMRPGLDQSELTQEVGVDRATLANVLARLEKRGLVRRERTVHDRRLKQVHLTPDGVTLLAEMAEPARRAHARTIAALTGADREAFLDGLTRLVVAGNGYGRAPMRIG